MIEGVTVALLTVSVKLWVASVPYPLWAVMVKVDIPASVGVPEIVAVPSPLSLTVAQLGNEPLSLRLGVGTPVVVTVNVVPAVPYVNALVLLVLVMVGGAPMFTVGSEPGVLGSVQAKGKALVEAASE